MPQTSELAEKLQLLLIGSQQCTFHRVIRGPCAFPPKCLKRWHKTRFLPVKLNFFRKTSAAKFLCVETSRGSVVATSFLCLTVHRQIAGDVPIYLKFMLKVTQPFRKHWFWQICLIVLQPWELPKKFELSLIGSRQCAIHWAIDEPCALPQSPPKGSSKREFLPAWR